MSNQMKTDAGEQGELKSGKVRNKDNLIGIDDIGLPADIRPDNATSPGKIKPDPEQAKNSERQ